MEKLFKSLLSIREIKLTTDDDHVDRLSRQYTVVILVCFAFLVTTKQFVGHPISCWCPAQFTESHRDYTNTMCWVSGTYYLPMEESIPADRYILRQHSKALVSYYQWVPFVLLFQAVMSVVPSLLWRFFNKRSGIHLVTIMDAARVCCRASYLEIREKAVRYIVNQMDRYLLAQRDHKTGCCIRVKHFIAKICCLVGGRLYGNYLTTAYVLVKVMYLANAVGQLFLLDSFLGNEFHMYGIYIADKLLRGQDWTQSARFPRVDTVRVRDTSSVTCPQLHRAMRVDNQPLQREDLYIPLVLVCFPGARKLLQPDEVDVPRPLLAGTGPVRAEAAPCDRRHASGTRNPGQVYRELPASRRNVHNPVDRDEHG